MQRKIDYRREAKKILIIAVRRKKKINYRHEAKKKLIITVRQRKIDYRLEAKTN
jgi:hypothetical protein